MRQHTVDLVMPADMADILINEGLGRPTFERRSTILTILADGASVASITISLLQGPATVMQVARGIKRWADEHRQSTPGSDRLTIVSSERGDARLVDADTDIAIIVEILQNTTIFKDDLQPPEGLDGLTI